MKIIENTNSIFVDCDDTLVMYGSEYYNEDRTNTKLFDCSGVFIELTPNEKNIQYLKNHKKLNNGTVIVWSAGGWDWALRVVKTLGLEEYVDAVMEKPQRYVDDLPCEKFMGTRVYKEMK